ncbi:MAG: MFS transporter [Gammaproteobacteria bacterium]
MSTDAHHAQAAAGPAPMTARFRWLLAALVVAELTCALESNMVTVALARLYGQYGDPLHVTWLITAYSLTAAATVAVSSRLGDLYGRRRMLVVTLGFAAVGSLISLFGTSLNVIIAGRAVQGASLAVLPLAFGIVREHAADSREVGIGVGVLGGTFSFSTGMGIVLGGVIVDHAPWQYIFLASATVAVLAIGFVLRILPRDRPRAVRGRIDWIGGTSFVIPLTAVLLSLNFGKAQGWQAPLPWALLLGGAAGIATWVRYMLRQSNPLIDIRLLGVRRIALANAVICTFTLGPLIYPQVLLPLLQQPQWTGVGLGISATLAGLIKLPTNVTSAVAAIYAGYAAHRFTLRRVVILAAAANLLAWVLLLFFHDSAWSLALAAVLLIAPAGTIIFGVAPGLIIEAAPADRTSEATGMTTVLRGIALAVGSQIVALCLTTSSIVNAAGEKYPDERAYLAAFLFVTACGAASLVLALMLPRPAPPGAVGAA